MIVAMNHIENCFEEMRADWARIQMPGTVITDIPAVCDRLGVRLHAVGMVYDHGHGKMPMHVVMIDTNRSQEDQRYQAAFECGHCLMDSVNYRDQMTDMKAKRFALALLMPADDVKLCMRRYSGRERDVMIMGIAQTFRVTQERAMERLEMLGY